MSITLFVWRTVDVLDNEDPLAMIVVLPGALLLTPIFLMLDIMRFVLWLATVDLRPDAQP